VCYLIAEGGTPRKIKVAYLTDSDIAHIADYAVAIRRTGRNGSPTRTHQLAA
jgi:S-DNA-T family DNA segregation ATPase FtsK/SpoIIIE